MNSIMTSSQQDRVKGWLHLVRKKTTRLSTRITARLGIISLARDEEFEKHYETFKHIEKTIRNFVKNLNAFVDHFESFLVSLQNTSENLAEFYRDKKHHKELDELRRKNKALACEHFHQFRRTVDRHVVTVSNQLLQKFAGPQQLISKRSAKLLDYDNRSREMEACRDDVKKESIKDQYVIAKDLYERINKQLIEELPLFNQFALLVFKECIVVLLESRRNLILSYTKQTASLLDTPLMMTYTASEVASNILMSCATNGDANNIIANGKKLPHHLNLNCSIGFVLDNGKRPIDGSQTTGQTSSSGFSRPQSTTSHLSSDLDRLPIGAVSPSREISSTPLSNVSDQDQPDPVEVSNIEHLSMNRSGSRYDELDGAHHVAKNFNRIDEQPNQYGPDDDREADRYIEKPTNDNNNPSFRQLSSPVTVKSNQKKQRKQKFPIFVASWPFVATGPNQLSITTRQQLKLIKACDECGNSDWSLVQDKRGQVGYVPSSYIVKRA